MAPVSAADDAAAQQQEDDEQYEAAAYTSAGATTAKAEGALQPVEEPIEQQQFEETFEAATSIVEHCLAPRFTYYLLWPEPALLGSVSVEPWCRCGKRSYEGCRRWLRLESD